MADVAEDEATTTDAVLTAVGPRLRALRQQRRLTLTQLSEETGVSVSTLSRLESGQRRPTLELLLPLARAHQVPLDELVGAPETGDPRVHLRPRTATHGLTVVPLTRRPGGIQAFKMVYAPHTPAGEPELQTHEGYDWVYVLSGRLRLLLGEQDLTIEPGEAVEFTTLTPHWFGAIDGPVEAIALFGAHGERLHLRA